MKVFMMVALLVSLSSCSTTKPPPKWPDGQERPINSMPVEKTSASKG